MRTFTVEIKDEFVLSFLYNLERLNLLKLKEQKKPKPTQKLSERFSGSISKERASEFQAELIEMKEESN